MKVLNDQATRMSEEVLGPLLLDAFRKAENTRAKDRVRRIGLILANAMIETAPKDSDEIEEMMRVAMELSDRDIYFLKELVKLEGHMLEGELKRIPRHAAHVKWIEGPWGERVDPELDSVSTSSKAMDWFPKLRHPTISISWRTIKTDLCCFPKGRDS